MKWTLFIVVFFIGCAPFSQKGSRHPSSSDNAANCFTSIDLFMEHTALTPFEKRTQILYSAMLDKKKKVSFVELNKMENQAELLELLESINNKLGLPEIDFAAWIKDHGADDLKTMLKIFKKMNTEHNVTTRDLEILTLKLYRLLNGYRPFYKKIPFYSNLQEILKSSNEEKILQALRTKAWIDGLNSHVKSIGRYQDPNLRQRLLINKDRWSKHIKLTLASVINTSAWAFTGDLNPVYVPSLKFFDFKKMSDEIFMNLEKDGWQNTKIILEKNFKKSLALDRYYNYLTYTYNRTYWMYLASTTSILLYESYQEKQAKAAEIDKIQKEMEDLLGNLSTDLVDLAPKSADEQATDFAQSLRASGVSEDKIAELKQKFIKYSEENQSASEATDNQGPLDQK